MLNWTLIQRFRRQLQRLTAIKPVIAFDYSIGVKNAVFFSPRDLAPHILPEHGNSTVRMCDGLSGMTLARVSL